MMNIHKELPLSFPGLSTLPGPLTPFYTNIATLPRCPAFPLQLRLGYAAGILQGLCFGGYHTSPESQSVIYPTTCVAYQPLPTRFGLAGRWFHHWFTSGYTIPSCLPDVECLEVPLHSVVVEAASTFPCAPRVRLPPASTGCCDSPLVGPCIPPGSLAPRGARSRRPRRTPARGHPAVGCARRGIRRSTYPANAR